MGFLIALAALNCKYIGQSKVILVLASKTVCAPIRYHVIFLAVKQYPATLQSAQLALADVAYLFPL